MERLETKNRGLALRLVAVALSPFAVASLYLFFSRWPSDRFTEFSDYGALVISVLAGAVFVMGLPIRPVQRILLLIIYIPVLGALVDLY